jgi:hypothetical protein
MQSQYDFILPARSAAMANLSIRGLDPADLSALKVLASQENGSINSLVLRLLSQGLGRTQGKPALRRYDDLDALAGTWSTDDAAAFTAASVGFDAIEPELWK